MNAHVLLEQDPSRLVFEYQSQLYVYKQESLEDLLTEGLCREQNQTYNVVSQKNTPDYQYLEDYISELNQLTPPPVEPKIIKKRATRRVFKKRSESIANLKELEDYVAAKWGRSLSRRNSSTSSV